PFGSAGKGSWGDLVAAHKLQSPPSVRDRRPEAPTALARLVAHLLAKQPDQRPASALEVAEALTPLIAGHNLPALLADSDVTPKPASAAPGPALRRRLGRSPLMLAAGAALAAAVLVAVVLWLKKQGTDRSEPPGHASASLPDTYTNSQGMEFVRVP